MFPIFESSRHKSKPYYLYLIRYGDGVNDFFAFTNNDFPVTKDGLTYVTVGISHSDISTTGTLDKSAVELSTPRTNPLFDLFRVYPPSYRVRLTIMKGHFSDPDIGIVTIWSGRILGMTVRGNECLFNCEPISTAMKRPGLRRNWQYGCPHALYGTQCRANKNAVMKTATVVAIDNDKVTLTANWNGAIATGKFVGGFAELSENSLMPRTILQVTGNTLRFAGQLTGLKVGDSISVYPGCAHDMNDCKSVHNNIVNFGGQPWIPTDNPVGSKNNFY